MNLYKNHKKDILYSEAREVKELPLAKEEVPNKKKKNRCCSSNTRVLLRHKIKNILWSIKGPENSGIPKPKLVQSPPNPMLFPNEWEQTTEKQKGDSLLAEDPAPNLNTKIPKQLTHVYNLLSSPWSIHNPSPPQCNFVYKVLQFAMQNMQCDKNSVLVKF